MPRLRTNASKSCVLMCARFFSVRGASESAEPPSTLRHSIMGVISELKSSNQCSPRAGSCQGWHTAGSAATSTSSHWVSPGANMVQLVTSARPSSVRVVSPG